MLRHLRDPGVIDSRVVVLGARGFIGGAIARRLTSLGASVLGLGSDALDLCAPRAGELLAERLDASDALVFVSAIAPCRDTTGLLRNAEMAHAVCEALRVRPLAHLVYVSSDAVYPDRESPIRESSCASAPSLHGVMHLVREVMLASAFRGPIAILRPSLVYGARDPHDGYGPNRFRRLAASGKGIRLFGNGEEKRDHVLVEDVAELAVRCLAQRSEGVLNVVTGTSVSFREIAERVVSLFEKPVEITATERQTPIVHRHFDATAVHHAFPAFRFTTLERGLARAHADALDGDESCRNAR